MMDFIKDWIINIIALVLLLVLVEILLPSGKTRKYINLVTGFILIIAIINPFIKAIKNGVNLEDMQLSGAAALQKAEIQKNSAAYNEDQMKQIVEVYRQKVIKQLERSAEETAGVARAYADVVINDDYKLENFGELKRAYIYVSTEGTPETVKSVGSVGKIRVNVDPRASENDTETDRDKESSTLDPEIRKGIEEKVGKLFSLPAEDVVVNLQKK